MKVWITIVGKSPFAVINPIWIACKSGEFIPEKVYLIWNDAVKGEKEMVVKAIKVILKNYGVPEPEIIADDSTKVHEEDFRRLAELLLSIRRKELREGNEIAIDMTPGRKFMSAIAMFMGVAKSLKDKVHRVYYLHLSDQRYLNYPLILIPHKLQKLYEMRRELGVTSKE